MVLVEQLRVSHESYCSYFNVFNILNTVLWLNAKTKTEIMIHCSKQPSYRTFPAAPATSRTADRLNGNWDGKPTFHALHYATKQPLFHEWKPSNDNPKVHFQSN